jgi:hypothetical protein
MSEQPETESPSIEDRLAAQFEPEQSAAEASPEQPEQETATESDAQPEFAEVEFEGKAYQVPPEIKDALLRQSDYTKKTTEVRSVNERLSSKSSSTRPLRTERKFRESVSDDVSQMQEIDFQIKQWKSVDVTGLHPS